jgi:hypothetical protein
VHIPRAVQRLVRGMVAEHLIRSSGHIVQDRPLRSVRWADIPQLSIRGWRCPPSWQQFWQQSRRDGTDPRPRGAWQVNGPGRYQLDTAELGGVF